MNNQERAIEVMMDANDGFTEGDVSRMAVALADAGLLMPDLPEPEKAYDDPDWYAEHRKWWEDEFGECYSTPSVWELQTSENQSIAVFPAEKDGLVCHYHGFEPEEPVDAETARRIGLAWLAAAKLAEKSTDG